MEHRKICDVCTRRKADADEKSRWKKVSTWLILGGVVYILLLFLLAIPATAGSTSGDLFDLGNFFILMGAIFGNPVWIITGIVIVGIGVVVAIAGG